MSNPQHTAPQAEPSDQTSQTIQLSGRLDSASTPDVWKRLQTAIQTNPHITLDLSQVESADSAALALLLQAKQTTSQQSGVLSLHNIPADLLDLARLSNIDQLLTSTS